MISLQDAAGEHGARVVLAAARSGQCAGLAACLMHMVFHALMKISLFLAAGVFNIRGHAYDVRDLRGIASKLPLICWIFALGSLAMTGIPPLIGFVSKWALAEAAAMTGGLVPLLGIGALLASAILTGSYLMIPTVMMYSGKRPETAPQTLPVEPGMRVTLIAISAMVIVLTFYSKPLIDFLTRSAFSLM